MEPLGRLDSAQVVYRHGAAGPKPVLRGTNLRVQTLVIAVNTWGMTPAEVASDYGLSVEQVLAALAFYAEHRTAIDAQIADEAALERAAALDSDQEQK